MNATLTGLAILNKIPWLLLLLCTSAKHSGQATLFAKRQFLIFG